MLALQLSLSYIVDVYKENWKYLKNVKLISYNCAEKTCDNLFPVET